MFSFFSGVIWRIALSMRLLSRTAWNTVLCFGTPRTKRSVQNSILHMEMFQHSKTVQNMHNLHCMTKFSGSLRRLSSYEENRSPVVRSNSYWLQSHRLRIYLICNFAEDFLFSKFPQWTFPLLHEI